jgi:CheY-like chemotaxis protein
MTKGKILIIDDEKLLVKSTSMALSYFNFTVESALNGQEGLKKAAECAPDLILLDIMMPGMDGWQVLAQLKINNSTKNIPVVLFTAKEYSNGKALAEEKGAVDFITKPFELEEMVEILTKYINK